MKLITTVYMLCALLIQCGTIPVHNTGPPKKMAMTPNSYPMLASVFSTANNVKLIEMSDRQFGVKRPVKGSVKPKGPVKQVPITFEQKKINLYPIEVQPIKGKKDQIKAPTDSSKSIVADTTKVLCAYCQKTGNISCIAIYCFQENNANSEVILSQSSSVGIPVNGFIVAQQPPKLQLSATGAVNTDFGNIVRTQLENNPNFLTSRNSNVKQHLSPDILSMPAKGIPPPGIIKPGFPPNDLFGNPDGTNIPPANILRNHQHVPNVEIGIPPNSDIKPGFHATDNFQNQHISNPVMLTPRGGIPPKTVIKPGFPPNDIFVNQDISNAALPIPEQGIPPNSVIKPGFPSTDNFGGQTVDTTIPVSDNSIPSNPQLVDANSGNPQIVGPFVDNGNAFVTDNTNPGTISIDNEIRAIRDSLFSPDAAVRSLPQNDATRPNVRAELPTSNRGLPPLESAYLELVKPMDGRMSNGAMNNIQSQGFLDTQIPLQNEETSRNIPSARSFDTLNPLNGNNEGVSPQETVRDNNNVVLQNTNAGPNVMPVSSARGFQNLKPHSRQSGTSLNLNTGEGSAATRNHIHGHVPGTNTRPVHIHTAQGFPVLKPHSRVSTMDKPVTTNDQLQGQGQSTSGRYKMKVSPKGEFLNDFNQPIRTFSELYQTRRRVVRRDPNPRTEVPEQRAVMPANVMEQSSSPNTVPSTTGTERSAGRNRMRVAPKGEFLNRFNQPVNTFSELYQMSPGSRSSKQARPTPGSQVSGQKAPTSNMMDVLNHRNEVPPSTTLVPETLAKMSPERTDQRYKMRVSPKGEFLNRLNQPIRTFSELYQTRQQVRRSGRPDPNLGVEIPVV